jgi:hypothetical protein
MARVETLHGEAWRDFIAAPVAVLVLGKSDCAACAAWSADLERFLATDRTWSDVRVGKILLDEGGLADFKRANPWIADLDALPFTQIYVGGRPVTSFVGGSIERLVRRLQRVTGRSAPHRPSS